MNRRSVTALLTVSHILTLCLGMLIGTILTLLDIGQVSLHIGPPVNTVVYNQNDHYLTEVRAQSAVNIEGAGSAAITVNVPDEIAFTKVYSSPPPTTTPDPLLDALLRHSELTMFEHDVPFVTETRPEFVPDQITALDQIHIGMCMNLLHQFGEPWGPYMVMSDPYELELSEYGDVGLFVDLLWPSGLVLEHSLADAGVIAYEGGKWNTTNRAVLVDCPPPPPPVPAPQPFDRQLEAN